MEKGRVIQIGVLCLLQYPSLASGREGCSVPLQHPPPATVASCLLACPCCLTVSVVSASPWFLPPTAPGSSSPLQPCDFPLPPFGYLSAPALTPNLLSVTRTERTCVTWKSPTQTSRGLKEPLYTGSESFTPTGCPTIQS